MMIGLLKLVGLVEELDKTICYSHPLEDGSAEVQVYNFSKDKLGPMVKLGVFSEDFERKYLREK